MGKQYYFLAGLHRSGNTVLSSILNQNPDFYVSPISPLVEYMWRCHIDDFEGSLTNPKTYRKNKMISEMIKNYYEDIDKPVIVDRSKSWANPDNIVMIKQYISEKPKVIFTIRPLIECVASEIKIRKEHILLDMKKAQYPINNKFSINDNIAEFILQGNLYFTETLAIQSLSDPSNSGIIHIVDYHELINSPTNTINNIYNFLDLPEYTHDFKNIKRIEHELDLKVGLPADLHKIRKKLESSGLKPLDYVSQNIVDKCNEMDLFYS